MTCPNCRHSLSRGETVCSKCGCRIPQQTGSASARRKNTILIICAIALILVILAVGLSLVTRVIGSFGEAETELQYTSEKDAPSADMLREAWENKTAQAAEEEAPAAEPPAQEEEPLIIAAPEEPEPEPPAEPEEEPEAETPSDEYIFPESDSRYLTEEEVLSKTSAELRIARNEIYARHGRMFASEDLDAHFRATSWYEPRYTAEEFDALGASMLNKYETANIDLILEVEAQRPS